MNEHHDIGQSAGAHSLAPSDGKSAVWGFWGTLAWGLLIGLVFVAVQMAVVGAYLQMAVQSEAGTDYQQATTDGDVLAWATIVSALICSVLVVVAVASKRGSNVRNYLGLYPVRVRQLAAWTGLFIGLLILLDLLTSLLDRPATPEVMLEVYASADSKLLLFVGTVVAASVFEELFFRGFLMEGWGRSPVGSWGSVVVTAAFWSAVHVQYDVYGVATIFIIGLFLGTAKLRSGSTVFAMGLHALNNAIAFFFLMFLLQN